MTGKVITITPFEVQLKEAGYTVSKTVSRPPFCDELIVGKRTSKGTEWEIRIEETINEWGGKKVVKVFVNGLMTTFGATSMSLEWIEKQANKILHSLRDFDFNKDAS